MVDSSTRIKDVRPKLRRRTCGGWIAVCPSKAGLTLGVTAPTEREAVEKFGFAFRRWLEIIELKALDVPKTGV
jgi:hypothetical protein